MIIWKWIKTKYFSLSALLYINVIITIFAFPSTVFSSFPIEPEEKPAPEAELKTEDMELQLIPIEEEGIIGEPHLQTYKENYFLFLSTRGDAKFQISFKYKLFTKAEEDRDFLWVIPLIGQRTFWEKLYFGYTQKSVWDWNKSSAPFEDHNFNPELFWCSDDKNCNALKRSDSAWNNRYYIGLEHESNGQDGPESRSWNRVYARWVRWYGSYAIAPKVWYVLSKSGNNQDITDYLGYFDLELFARKPNGLAYGTTIRHGSKEGSILLDLSFPHRLIFKKSDFNPHWFIQYFAGYGENLLNYNVQRNVLRLGLRLSL